MDPVEIMLTVPELIITINAITGWAIPSPSVASVLDEQFAKKMVEGYANVNAEEVKYAFRTYGTTVKDWGKSMNLSLIDEVMIPYLEARSEVSRMEEEKKSKELPAPQNNMSDETMDAWLRDQKELVLSGKMKIEFMPVMLYDYLANKGVLNPTNKEKSEQLIVAAKFTQAKLNQNATDRDSLKEAGEFNTMMATGEFTGKWAESLKSLAKRMLLYKYFQES